MWTYTFARNKASWSSTLTSNLLVIVVKLLHCNCNISNLDIGLLTTILEDVTWLINDGHDVSSNLRLMLGLRKEWDKWIVILFIKDYFLLNIFLVAWSYVTSNCSQIWSLCNIDLFTPSSFIMPILNSFKVSPNLFLRLFKKKPNLGTYVMIFFLFKFKTCHTLLKAIQIKSIKHFKSKDIGNQKNNLKTNKFQIT